MSHSRLRSPAASAISLLAPLLLIGLTMLIGASGTPSFEDTVTLILCNLTIVLGLQVFIGNSGVYSFGQIGFAASGAYFAALLTLPPAMIALQTPGLPELLTDAQLGPVPSTLIAAVACGLLAAVVGLPLMRTSTLAIPISTFAFLVVTYNVLANWDRVTAGSSGLVSIPTTTSIESAGLWAAVALIVVLIFKWSASGYRLQATREDEVAARSIGVRVMKERMIAFAISGVLCGIGGALTVHQSSVLNPNTFYFSATVTTLTMLVIGGTRSVFGAVIGVLSVATVNEVLRSFEDGAELFGAISIGNTPGLAAIGLGLILLGAMIALPDGLSGGREAGELPWVRRLHSSASLSPPHKDAKRAIAVSRVTKSQTEVLSVRGVSVSFSGLHVLRNVDLELRRGELLGLIGPNGAGKTTLVNVISGFQVPDSGSVTLNGREITNGSPARLAREGLARTFQAALPFLHLSSLESVAVGAMGVGRGKREATAIATEVLGRLNLLDKAEVLAGALPPRDQRLLGIARALATGPRYLLLDEPAAGLGDEEREALRRALVAVLEDFECGILLIEHDVNVVMRLCPRLQVLDDGRAIRVGTPAEVQADPKVIEAYLGRSFLTASDA